MKISFTKKSTTAQERYSGTGTAGKSLFLQYILFILTFALTTELVLEYRHFRLGYDTPLLGTRHKIQPTSNKDTFTATQIAQYGPTSDFPFRSLILPKKKQLPRIWIASASHAISSRIHPDKIFPNMICSTGNCEVLNGSAVGMTIVGNIDFLRKYAGKYTPDAAILYQMSMFIANESARRAMQKLPIDSDVNPLFDATPLLSFLQRFSLYIHLNDVIGGNLTLQGQLNNAFPSDSLNIFKSRLKMYINACREMNIRPILSTFAASHDKNNVASMPALQKTNFVKWVQHPYLSPEGWTNTIVQLNDVIRTIAADERVQLIDIARYLNGIPEYFVDFVHLNEAGHAVIAEVISSELFEKSAEGFE